MIRSTDWPECFKASTKPGLKYVNVSILFTIHALPHKFKTADELRNNNSALFIGHLHYLGFSDATKTPPKNKTKSHVRNNFKIFKDAPTNQSATVWQITKKGPVSNASYTYASQQSSHSLTIKILTVIIFFLFFLLKYLFPVPFFLNFHHPSFPPPFAAFCYKAITLTLTITCQCLY